MTTTTVASGGTNGSSRSGNKTTSTIVKGGRNGGGGSGAVDLITGKVTTEYYFDPSLLLPPGGGDGIGSITKTPLKSSLLQRRNSSSVSTSSTTNNHYSDTSSTTMMTTNESLQFFHSKYLYMPCTIIKPLLPVQPSPPVQPQIVTAAAAAASDANTDPVVVPPSSPSSPIPAPVPVLLSSQQPSNGGGGKKKKKKHHKGKQQQQQQQQQSPTSSSNTNITTPQLPTESTPATTTTTTPAKSTSAGLSNTTTIPLNHPQQQQPFAGPTLIKTSIDGALHKITDSTRLIPMQASTDYDGVADLLQLADIQEAAIIHTLRIRYAKMNTATGSTTTNTNHNNNNNNPVFSSDIYTNAGQILISINPYKPITMTITTGNSNASSNSNATTTTTNESIYSERVMMLYRNQTSSGGGGGGGGSTGRPNHHWTNRTLPPHLFQVADRAYTALMESSHSTLLSATSTDQYTNGGGGGGDMDGTAGYESSQYHHTDSMGHNGSSGSSSSSHYPVRNQSIIISGESGAGKTEATKIIMKYLVNLTRHRLRNSNKSHRTTTTTSSGAGSSNKRQQSSMVEIAETLENRVLSSNPLLETFGNAQTLRNNNSSRFGKFIHIYFNCITGSITGASISNYLLEKTRITNQVDGERNYHIFYQLLVGPDTAMIERYGLHCGMEQFRYLGNRKSDSSVSPSSIVSNDAKCFQETVSCLRNIGLSDEEQQSVFGMAAAILHLGNVQFEENKNDHGETARITDDTVPSLQKACELLGLNVEKVSEAILTKVIVVNGKSICKPQNVTMAEDKCDAFAKMTYSYLFLWLVNCVNEKLRDTTSTSTASTSKPSISSSYALSNGSNNRRGFIGVLDIYGFECFDVNGFEQLLINYCNEKLQRHFNRHLFEVEQELYNNEGVDWSYITFNDNRQCLELIEGGSGSAGILHTLDDAWGGMGTIDKKDEKFMKQILSKFGGDTATDGHPHFVASKFLHDRDFTIIHYAGEVKYTVDGFVERNMDTLSNELRELGENSRDPVAKRVYSFCSTDMGPPIPAGTTSRSSIRGVSVGAQFRTSLQTLVVDLERTQPHYIRCIKPNLSKMAGTFSAGEVLKQLRYSGMMEAIRIRQEGYALREAHESFYERFSVLLNPEDIQVEGNPGIEHLVKILSQRLGVSDSDWQLGHSKIFLRRELSDKLERLARLRVYRAARTLTSFGSQVARRRCGSFLAIWIAFRIRMRKYRQLTLSASKIAALARGVIRRKSYRTAIISIVLLQAHIRRLVALRIVQKLKDPTVEDTQKHPVTKASIEKEIISLREQLGDAVQSKTFSKCGPLQDRIDALLRMKKELPSIDELREAVKKAEKVLSRAVINRDFKGAAEAQELIDTANEQIVEELLDTENAGDTRESMHDDIDDATKGMTRFQLESDIADIWGQITDAITDKNFGNANTLQKALEEKERLRILIPSADELQTQLLNLKSRIDTFVAKRDFGQASVLSEGLFLLEKKLAAEQRAETIKKQVDQPIRFESRSKLEEEIASTSSMISRCVTERDFQKADSLQKDLNSLINLRDSLPSIKGLRSSLNGKRADMDAAVVKCQFDLADELHKSITNIESSIVDESDAFSNGITIHAEKNTISNASTDVKSKASVPDSKVVAISSVVQESLPLSTVAVNGKHNSYVADAKTIASAAKVPMMSATSSVMTRSITSKSGSTKPNHKVRTVEKLRPVVPLVGEANQTVSSIAKMLTIRRGNACVVVNEIGALIGILTDTDMTRRVVAKFADPESIAVSEIMTPNPTCVALTDSAMDALTTMVEHHFRHLPVVDSNGSVVGLLDIAKCLDDAITKLERKHERSTAKTAENVAKQVITLQGASQAAALQALLSNILSQGLAGQSMISLRGVLAGKPKTIVSPTSTIQDAGIVMAQDRKASLIVDNGVLVGVFTFKDMMTRVLAKDVSLTISVSEVMTPNPASVSPDISVLEALQIMHDQRFLTLPVCENDGTVVGLVDVMDVIYGCGGTSGWRSIFSSAMECHDEDSEAGTASRASGKNSTGLYASQHDYSENASISSRNTDFPIARIQGKNDKSVAKLRPMIPHICRTDDTILSVTQTLKIQRGSACLIVNGDGTLAGILTDTDITRRVVAKYVDPATTNVDQVMTRDPTCVSMSDSATDALTIMVENHFRHLPVVDDLGAVVGLLDITKCLNDAISKLEKKHEGNSNVAENAIHKAIVEQGGDLSQIDAIQGLLANLISQAFGSTVTPSLRSLLAGKPSTIVSPDTSIRNTGIVMGDVKKAALIVDEGELLGIFSFKDCMTRAVAAQLSLETTPISEVMTPYPETVSPDISILEALQIMHDQRFLTLPVCEANGTVVGLVDVMDVIYGCGGADGWRSIFKCTMDIEDSTVIGSTISKQKLPFPTNRETEAMKTPLSTPRIPLNIPATLEFVDHDDQSFTGSTIGDERGVSKLMSPDELSESIIGFSAISFKVQCKGDGSSHRIRCEPKIDDLLHAISTKTSLPPNRIQIEYEDDEGDVVRISSDDDVIEAYNLARKSGHKLAKLTLTEIAIKPESTGGTFVVAGGVAIAALVGITGILLLRSKPK